MQMHGRSQNRITMTIGTTATVLVGRIQKEKVELVELRLVAAGVAVEAEQERDVGAAEVERAARTIVIKIRTVETRRTKIQETQKTRTAARQTTNHLSAIFAAPSKYATLYAFNIKSKSMRIDIISINSCVFYRLKLHIESKAS